ncbi:MAG: hypothetical protein JWR84_3446 [Caulobacter sp.]|nr:hypothetical protein [Caulobacter sp.]
MKTISFDMEDVAARLAQKWKPRRFDAVEHWLTKAFSQGWLAVCDVQDLIADYDDRLWQFKFREFAERCGIGEVQFFPRPRRGEKEVWGQGRFDLSRVTALLIQIERLGFDVDAVEWVKRIRPDLLKKEYLEVHELAIFWYAEERGKLGSVYALPRPMAGNSFEYFQTATGHHVVKWFDEKGTLLNMEVMPPKTKGLKARLKMERDLQAYRRRVLRPAS